MARDGFKTPELGKNVFLDDDDYAETEKGWREPTTTGSTGTTIEAGGITLLAVNSTSIGTYTIEAPHLGAQKILITTGTSTAQVVATPSTASIFRSTAASTSGGGYTQMTFTGIGQLVRLHGVSSSVWQVGHAHASVTLSTV